MSGRTGYLADWDGIETLAEDLDDLADYFDGGQTAAFGSDNFITAGGHAPTAEGDLRSDIELCQPHLGPANVRPSVESYLFNTPRGPVFSTSSPAAEALDDFVDSWETAQEDIAAELRAMSQLVRWAADEYRDTDLTIAFQVTSFLTPYLPE